MLRFLPGIILIQLITTGLIFAGFRWSHDLQLVVVMGLIGLIIGTLAAFWFNSIARALRSEAIARVREDYALEREQIVLSAEREKATVVHQSYQRIEKETKRIHAKANFKIGLAFAAAAAAGSVMLVTQFVTLGLIVLVGSGSGLAGYLTRARQERLVRDYQSVVNVGKGQGNLTEPVPRLGKKDQY